MRGAVVEQALPAAAVAARVARQVVAQTLHAWRLDGLADAAVLLTSEVVTNAVLHTRTPPVLRLRRQRGGVRVEVDDGAPRAPTRRRPSPTATTGRGLRLLDQLADDWGVEVSGAGKTVWFRLQAGGDPWARLAGTDWFAEGEA